MKKHKIASVIASRLSSNRLNRKALIKIGDLSLVEICIKNYLLFENVDYTILATSNLEEDKELENYLYDDSVKFYRGYADNLIKRSLFAMDDNIDIMIRGGVDSPYVSNDILQFLLKKHIKSGADYTTPKNAALGTNQEIINVSALKTIDKHFPEGKYSEYMSYYFINNPKVFKLNYVDLPTELIRDYRLTCDYEIDVKLFELIETYFKDANIDYNIHSLFKFLDNNPEIGRLNKDCMVKYKQNKELVDKIIEHTTIKI